MMVSNGGRRKFVFEEFHEGSDDPRAIQGGCYAGWQRIALRVVSPWVAARWVSIWNERGEHLRAREVG